MSTAAAASAGPSGRSPLRTLIAVLLILGTAAAVLHDWLGLGGGRVDLAVNGVAYDAVILAAGLACLLRAREADSERGAWIAIGGSILAWGAGEVYWTAALFHDPSPPYPSPADVGYLAFYPLAALGLYLLVRARTRELDWRLWMDGLIAALGTAALGTAFVFDFVADRTSGSWLEQATTLAYPLGDVVMLALVVGIVALTRWRPGRTWALLLSGLAALVIADVAFTLQEADPSFPQGDWIEPIYLLAALCLGAEAWQPRAATIEAAARFDGWRELMVPGIFAAILAGLFAMQALTSASLLSTALWVATMGAVLVRLAISVNENKRLLERVRTDPLTGLGNRGAMQVDFDEGDRRGEERPPVTLALFDLDGFKRFNDTFGHPEGDVLLARLGRALRDAVGDDGTAYRFGGDEFCVVLRGEGKAAEAVCERAAAAFSASGRDFEVSASWGTAAIPAEAADSAEALRLADVRMYAQKESRRPSPGEALTLDPELATEPEASALEREAVEQDQQHRGDLGPAGGVL
ncbi:MAG TPA: GGDEF domain-containing protein [Solirubrobacterales bacterium]|nr:GGDEF domain-containing protein [Solirubrobacterales bacterium]